MTANALNAVKTSPRRQQSMIDEMLSIIARETVPERIHRSEPRAVKERPKNFRRLSAHRSVYVVPKYRKKKTAKKVVSSA